MMVRAHDQDWNPCSNNSLGSGYYKWIYIGYYAIISKKRVIGGEEKHGHMFETNTFWQAVHVFLFSDTSHPGFTAPLKIVNDPSPHPSPQRGEGKGEGGIAIGEKVKVQFRLWRCCFHPHSRAVGYSTAIRYKKLYSSWNLRLS